MTETGEPAIVFFDGVCNLCNGFVDFLIRRDRKRRLRYASLQSPRGTRMTAQHCLPELQTIVLVDEEGIHLESRAVIRAITMLGRHYRAFAALRVVPRPLSDAIYRFVARRRYRVFGKRATCRVPSEEEAALFVES